MFQVGPMIKTAQVCEFVPNGFAQFGVFVAVDGRSKIDDVLREVMPRFFSSAVLFDVL